MVTLIKKNEVVIISDRVDNKSKNISRDKNGIMVQGSIHNDVGINSPRRYNNAKHLYIE